MAKTDITAQRLRELLDYNAETGVFTWAAGARGRNRGDVAGTFDARGYRVIRLNYFTYKAHRLAWLHAAGEWPLGVLDHINGDRADNRLANLRDCSQATNVQNVSRPRVDNTTGLMGVKRNHKRWSTRINIGGVNHYLGTYDTPEAAHEAYMLAKRRLHPGSTI